MWLKPKNCRKSLFHANEVAGYNKSVEGSILLIKNIEKINSRVVTQNGEIKNFHAKTDIRADGVAGRS
ncbi:hypothetical protein SFRURICE_021457 [Spodoptera frugiperda]|nr:hypothetical protein SFRURICE_021457 [Spodoptera frugiperda]